MAVSYFFGFRILPFARDAKWAHSWQPMIA
jgi:hypothetical protein